jgi:hypothetical protein
MSEAKTWDLRGCKSLAEVVSVSRRAIGEIIVAKLDELRAELIDRGFASAELDHELDRQRAALDRWQEKTLTELPRLFDGGDGLLN